MTVHKVKSWIKLFNPMLQGNKTHDLRLNDRNYQVGDILELQEYDEIKKEYTGRIQKVQITYLTSAENPCAMSDIGLTKDYVILSITKLP